MPHKTYYYLFNNHFFYVNFPIDDVAEAGVRREEGNEVADAGIDEVTLISQ